MNDILVDCTWSEWTHGPCSVSCGAGEQVNTRQIFPEMFGGNPCEGEATEVVTCTLDDCPGKSTYTKWENEIEKFDTYVEPKI